jgi:Na+-transporting methylmalonyl-CoA/oxaloacetate decarboxylase beta subunit
MGTMIEIYFSFAVKIAPTTMVNPFSMTTTNSNMPAARTRGVLLNMMPRSINATIKIVKTTWVRPIVIFNSTGSSPMDVEVDSFFK